MTKQERAAFNDLKKKVRELFRNAEKDAIKRIEKLRSAGVIEDHAREMNYRIPKDFLCAYAQELASPRVYGPWSDDRVTRRRIKNYYILM